MTTDPIRATARLFFSLGAGMLLAAMVMAWSGSNPSANAIGTQESSPLADGRGESIYVAPTGSDISGDGSITKPYKTIKKATAHEAGVEPGDTIFLRGGVYPFQETEDGLIYNRHGTVDDPIVVRPYDSEAVTLDGGLLVYRHNQSVVLIAYCTHIVFEGMEIRNSQGGRGISAYESEHITIRNNVVHDTDEKGIGITGNNITVEENEVYHTSNANEGGKGGWPQAVSTARRADEINPTTQVVIRNNHIHHNWGEGIAPILADGVLIEGNVLHDNYSVNIYVSKSRNVTINRNHIYKTTNEFNRKDNGRPPTGVTLANEDSSESQVVPAIEIDNISITNNILGEGLRIGISYWQAGGSYSNVRIYHNVLKGQLNEAVKFDKALSLGGNELINNIIYDGTKGSRSLAISNADIRSWIFTHNNWVDGIPKNGTHTFSFSADPQFVGPFNKATAKVGAYKLRPRSSSTAAGTPVSVHADFWESIRSDRHPSLGVHEPNPPTNE